MNTRSNKGIDKMQQTINKEVAAARKTMKEAKDTLKKMSQYQLRTKVKKTIKKASQTLKNK